MRRDRRYKAFDVWRCPEDGYVAQTEPGFYRDPDAPPEPVECACGCGATFTPDPNHPWQRYASTAHRMRAYRRRRKGGSR